MIGEQVQPLSKNYKGGYTTLTRCAFCERTALYSVQQPSNPCPCCGSFVVEMVGRWIEPVYEYKFLFFGKKLLAPGYWLLK